jgi:hypothetical protein
MADMLMIYQIKDLGFVDIAGIGPGMEDTVGIHREILAVAFGNAFFKAPPASLGAAGGIQGEPGFLLAVKDMTQIPQINHLRLDPPGEKFYHSRGFPSRFKVYWNLLIILSILLSVEGFQEGRDLKRKA